MIKESDYEKLEGLIFKAVQSGKQETSSLANDILRKIEPSIEKSIEKYVNGKIRAIDQKLSDYITNDDKWKEEFGEAMKFNTEFRLKTQGGLGTMQWLLGFVGLGTIISLISVFVK